MIKCENGCYDICDFCKYHYVSDPMEYSGEAFCKKHNKVVDLVDSCEDFHCRNAKEVK